MRAWPRHPAIHPAIRRRLSAVRRNDGLSQGRTKHRCRHWTKMPIIARSRVSGPQDLAADRSPTCSRHRQVDARYSTPNCRCRFPLQEHLDWDGIASNRTARRSDKRAHTATQGLCRTDNRIESQPHHTSNDAEPRARRMWISPAVTPFQPNCEERPSIASSTSSVKTPYSSRNRGSSKMRRVDRQPRSTAMSCWRAMRSTAARPDVNCTQQQPQTNWDAKCNQELPIPFGPNRGHRRHRHIGVDIVAVNSNLWRRHIRPGRQRPYLLLVDADKAVRLPHGSVSGNASVANRSGDGVWRCASLI